MLDIFHHNTLDMARTKKDTVMQTPAFPQAGDPETGDRQYQGEGSREMPAGEPRRTSTRAPTVPFSMVTRRGAQKRTSGGSEEHAVPSHDLVSAGEEEVAAVPAATGHGERESEPQGDDSGAQAPTADDAVDALRRSTRVVPKKVAPTVQKPSLIVKIRLRGDLLRRVEIPREVWEGGRQAGDSESSAPRSRTQKPVAGDETAIPTSPLPQSVGTLPEGSSVAAQAGASAPRQKRPRKAMAAASSAEEKADSVNPEEERQPKRRRKITKSSEGAAGEDAVVRRSAEPALPQQEPQEVLVNSSAVTPAVSRRTSPALGVATQVVAAPEGGPSLPEEPLQKRRGRPPKSELLKRQRQPRQPTVSAVAPPAPVDSLAHRFRERMPQGIQVLDLIALAKHMRDKNLKEKRREMKMRVRRGYRVEHRVTREWCTQRSQRLVGQQRKLNQLFRRANIGLLDQTVNLLHADPTYLSETGPAAPFFLEGLRKAGEWHAQRLKRWNMELELNRVTVADKYVHEKELSTRNIANDIADGLEKVAKERAHLSDIVQNLHRQHPEEIDAIIERCEASGEAVSSAIVERACELYPGNLEAEVDEIWKSRGRGLGSWVAFSDQNRMDVDEPEPELSNVRNDLEPEFQQERVAELVQALESEMGGPEAESLNVLADAAVEQGHLPGIPEPEAPQNGRISPALSNEAQIVRIPKPSTRTTFGGDGSADERPTEPGFVLSGPAPPLTSSRQPEEPEPVSRFTLTGDSTRRWNESRMYSPMERPAFSPLQTHHHYIPGPSPPLLSAASSVHSLPPPTALSSPSRLLPSPVPTTRFPAAYQALPQRSPSPGFFNPLPHDPRYHGEQRR